MIMAGRTATLSVTKTNSKLCTLSFPVSYTFVNSMSALTAVSGEMALNFIHIRSLSTSEVVFDMRNRDSSTHNIWGYYLIIGT